LGRRLFVRRLVATVKTDLKNLRESIARLLADKSYQPLDHVEMSRKLGLNQNQRVSLRKILREMEHAGEIARIRKNRYVLPDEADLVTGTLAIHPSGFAFLNTGNVDGKDIFVAAENTGTAMNGDRVVVRITRGADHPSRKNFARAEGRVIRILERAKTTIVGTLKQSPRFFSVIPDDPRLIHNVYVQVPPEAPSARNARAGDKVVVRLVEWESRHTNPEGEIIEVLGRSGAPGIDIVSIIRNYDLPTEFPKAVMDEAESISPTVEPRSMSGRVDLRDKFIVTIDPDDAKDFDDAIDVERLDGKGWRLGVHIADVAAYVTPGTALDREARLRGNSVYLPDRVIPMLPERLSNGVCSLKPDVDRLTHSAFIEFDSGGAVTSTRFARTIIRSAKRLTYKEAYAILQAPARDRLGEELHTSWELASLLRRKRFAHGSLDLDFPEVKVRLDDQGRPIALERIENDESHQLIEEFMLAANEAVARELKNRSIPTIYRVHEDPDPEKLADYRELILSYNYKVGDLTQRREIQKLLAAIKGKPEEPALKVGLLKSLKRARYLPQPLGHYGLAKTNYLHFTSPIRRYADLVAHRSLAGVKQTRLSGMDMASLATLAQHISDTERNAAEAEMEAVKMKKLEFFERQLTERNPQVFRAVIMDVKNFGLVIELPDALLTGLIHVSSLQDDFYQFDATQRRLTARRSRKRYSIGDQLQVFVARVDRFKRQIDFALADNVGRRPAKGQKRR
jgi:ribonuclease R